MKLGAFIFVFAIVACTYNLALSWSGNVTMVPALVGLGMAFASALMAVAWWRFG
jgi:hypothetical protein